MGGPRHGFHFGDCIKTFLDSLYVLTSILNGRQRGNELIWPQIHESMLFLPHHTPFSDNSVSLAIPQICKSLAGESFFSFLILMSFVLSSFNQTSLGFPRSLIPTGNTPSFRTKPVDRSTTPDGLEDQWPTPRLAGKGESLQAGPGSQQGVAVWPGDGGGSFGRIKTHRRASHSNAWVTTVARRARDPRWTSVPLERGKIRLRVQFWAGESQYTKGIMPLPPTWLHNPLTPLLSQNSACPFTVPEMAHHPPRPPCMCTATNGHHAPFKAYCAPALTMAPNVVITRWYLPCDHSSKCYWAFSRPHHAPILTASQIWLHTCFSNQVPNHQQFTNNLPSTYVSPATSPGVGKGKNDWAITTALEHRGSESVGLSSVFNTYSRLTHERDKFLEL